MSIKKLPFEDLVNKAQQQAVHITNDCTFPLRFNPAESYKSGGLKFGAPRPQMGPGILHPACDLVAPVGTEVLAVDDGVIINGPYEFHLGSYAIEVRHRYFIVRYGEIKRERISSPYVKRGQVIGHVAKVGKGSMLHFEMFTGDASGGLSQKNNPPWNRRKDMINPTWYLDTWSIGVPVQ